VSVLGILKGEPELIHHPDELEAVEYGEVVVLPESHPIYALAVMKASGLICENGGAINSIVNHGADASDALKTIQRRKIG
jgi:hypothetical protein